VRYLITAHKDTFTEALELLGFLWTEVIAWTPPVDLLEQTYGLNEIFSCMTVEVRDAA
jgi:hypothetical protein